MINKDLAFFFPFLFPASFFSLYVWHWQQISGCLFALDSGMITD